MNHNAKVATPISDALISLWSPYSFATDKAVSLFGYPATSHPSPHSPLVITATTRNSTPI